MCRESLTKIIEPPNTEKRRVRAVKRFQRHLPRIILMTCQDLLLFSALTLPQAEIKTTSITYSTTIPQSPITHTRHSEQSGRGQTTQVQTLQLRTRKEQSPVNQRIPLIDSLPTPPNLPPPRLVRSSQLSRRRTIPPHQFAT